MSGAAHPYSPVRKQILRGGRRAKVITVACLATIAALLVALVLAVPGGDSAPSGSDGASSPAAQQPAIPEAGTYASPGTRYDGGPDEGTRGAVEQPPIPQAGTYASPASGPEDGQ